MKQTAIEKLKEEAKLVRVDALSNVFAVRNSLVALVWFLILLGSCAVTGFLIASAFVQFNECQVTSTLRYNHEAESALPTLTFCSINPFKSDNSQAYLWMSGLLNASQADHDDYWRLFLRLEDYLNKTRGYTFTSYEKLHLAKSSFSFILDGFYYNEQSDALFERIWHPKYFNCLVFKPPEVFFKPSQYLWFILNLMNSGRGNLEGIFMFVQNSSSDYLLGNERQPIMMTKGSYTISISRTFINQQALPYSECGVLLANNNSNSLVVDIADRFVFDEVVRVTSTYSRANCVSFCTQMLIAQQCGCNTRRLSYKDPSTVAMCPLSKELGCVEDVWQAVTSINAQCMPKCPLECAQQRFSYVLDTKPEIHLGDYVELKLSYDNLGYTELIEKVKMTSYDLFGIIGGHLHIFLGMSFMSFVEIGELLLLFLLQTSGLRLESKQRFESVNADKIKIDAVPNAVRAPNLGFAVFWIGLLLPSIGVCIFLIINIVSQFNEYQVVTTVRQESDPKIAFRICNSIPFTNKHSIQMLSELNLTLANDPVEVVIDAENANLNKTGSYLTEEEWSLWFDLNRTVISCRINGAPCEFEFYFDLKLHGCYEIKPKNVINGNFDEIYFLGKAKLSESKMNNQISTKS